MRHTTSVPEEDDSIVRFPTRLCAITLGLTLATFGWVAWNGYATYRDDDLYRSRDSRLEELRGVILHLDEVLTMSARMAAATGESRWEKRYRKYEPELDAAIKGTMALAPGDSAIAASTQTDVANAKLVAMENEAFAFVRDGRGENARIVLSAPAYEEQKALYAEGMNALLTDVRTRIDNNLQQAKQRLLLSIVGSAALFGFSIGAWVTVMGSLRRTQSELTRRVDDRTIALTQANQTLLAEISERREVQAELVKARDTALQGTRAKTEFLANMSHEIRTPMNGVIGMTDLLQDTALDEEQRDCVEMIRTSSEHLLAVINDILDFSKIESRKLELESIPFSVREVVGTLLKPLAVKAEQKGLELLFDIDPGVPAGVVGDPVRLEQVLTNLVGNAIKFTERGHVMVGRAGGHPIRRIHAAALSSQRYRDRDSAGEARHHLRGLQSGRRIDDAPVWRHGAGIDDFLEPGAPDGRAHLGRERARPRQCLSLHRRLRHRRIGDRANRCPSRCSPRCRCSSSTTTRSTGASCTRS